MRAQKTQMIQGIDSLRFVAAATVMLGHIGLISGSLLTSLPHPLGTAGRELLKVLFNGPAAVIVFFVISGFCIHYANLERSTLNVPAFYARRFLRILPPAIVAGIGVVLTLGEPADWTDTVFWSIFCELIYYTLYPLLLLARRRVGWRTQFSIAFLVALGLVFLNRDLVHQQHNAYVALGMWTWVIGLPCWLLGCVAAESYRSFPVLSFLTISGFRLAILASAVVLRVLHFHATNIVFGSCVTLNVFAILVCAWLCCEVRYYSSRQPRRSLEWAGKWSYSLYLVHPIVPSIYTHLSFGAAEIGREPFHLLLIVSTLGLSWAFYLAVELPSHRLARLSGQSVDALLRRTGVLSIRLQPAR